MKAKLKTYVGTRARIILGIAVIATLVEATRAHPKEPTSKAVASMLGSAIGGSVEDEAFVWEPSLGPWVDLMWGRRVIFVGRMRGQALRDVFRARVRLDRKGTALSIAEHHALTKTTLGDERDLVVGKRSVAYRTVHEDRVVALTVLQHIDDGTRIGMFDTVKHWWKQWTDAGLRAHHVVFETPPQQARIESQTSGWVLSFGDPAMAATFIDGVLKKDKSQTDPYQAHSFTVYESAEARPKAQTITIEKRSPVAEAPAAVHLIESGKPGIEIRLIDTRRLNIGLAVGQRNPVAVTGPGASGDEPTRRRSIIRARFGGGETKADPEAGLVVAKRVLVPLKAHKPTLAIDRFGRAFIGRWPASSSSNASATRWEAIWQASEGLVTNGAIDESETLDLSVRRVTLCTTKDGQLLHAEAKNTTGRALAQALLAHGCLEAITLDNAFDPSIAMSLSEQPLREPVARSHLYLYDRPIGPTGSGTITFKAADGKQPKPSWHPSIFIGSTTEQGRPITVYAIDDERLHWSLLPGQREAAARTVQDHLDEKQREHTIIAFGIGVARRSRNRRGLVLNGVATIPLRSDLGVLLTASKHRRLKTGVTTGTLVPRHDASELQLLMNAGSLRSEARILGALRHRSALCQKPSGFTFVAHARSDNYEPLARALRTLGCDRIFALDRGRQTEARIHRADSSAPPQSSYAQTTLIGMEPTVSRGRTRRFGDVRGAAAASAPSPKKTTTADH